MNAKEIGQFIVNMTLATTIVIIVILNARQHKEHRDRIAALEAKIQQTR